MSETGGLILDQGSTYFGRSKTDQNKYLASETKSKEKFTRQEILTTFNSGYQRFEESAKQILLKQGFSEDEFNQWENNEELSFDNKNKLVSLDAQTKKTLSDFQILTAGKSLTIDKNLDYFKHNFENFSARERVPVEGLLRFLHSEISEIKNKVKAKEITQEEADNQIKVIYKEGYIIYKSSRLANQNIRVKKGADAIYGTKAHARARAEAKYISLNPLRSKNNLNGNDKLTAEFLDGINAMQNRRELVLPAETIQAENIKSNQEEYPHDHSDQSDLGVGNPYYVKEEKPQKNNTEYPQDNSDTSDLGVGNPYTVLPASDTDETSKIEGSTNDQENSQTEEMQQEEESKQEEEGKQVEEDQQEETTVPTTEEIRREFYIVNRSVDVRKRAAEIAETQLREEMRRGKWYNPKDFFRRVKLRLAEEFYRKQYKDRALKAMLENNNSYLDFDCVHNAVIDANRNRIGQKKSSESVITQLKSGELIAGQQVREAQGELKKAIIDQILKPITDGTVKSENEIRKKLQDFVVAHQNEQDIQDIFGRDTNKYKELADFFATDLWEMGKTIQNDVTNHRYALESIDEHLQIKLANSSWAAETEANFNFVDKAVAWAQDKPWKGAILNPASIGVITSVAYSAVTLLGKGLASKELNLIAPGIGSLVGGSFAALRRWHDLQHDIASHRVEMAYGYQMTPNSKRREAIERYNYSTASIQDLIFGAGTDLVTKQNRESIDDLLKQDLSLEPNQQKVINRIAEINQRLDLSVSQHIDLITVNNIQQEGLDVGRMELLKNVAEMKIKLRDAGLSDNDLNTQLDKAKTDWQKILLENKEEQDKAVKIYKIQQAALSGVFGSAVGMASFFGTQEALALGQRAVGIQVGATQLEQIIDRLGDLAAGRTHAETPTVGVLTELFQSGGNADLGNNLQMQIDPNTHSIAILDSNNLRQDIPLLNLDTDGTIDVNGKLPADIENAFINAGFKIDNASGPLLLDSGTPTYSSLSTGHETFIPKGTEWLNDQGKWDLVLASDNSKVLIDNANFNPDGTLNTFDSGTSLLDTNQVDFGLVSKTTIDKIVLGGQNHEDLTTGFKTMIPDGSKWIPDQTDPSKWDLVMENDSSKILVDNVDFDSNGVIVDYDEQNSLIKDQRFINFGKFSEKETGPTIWDKAGDYRVVHAKSEVALPIRNSVFATGEADNPLGVRFEFPDSGVHNPNTGATEYLRDAASDNRLGILLQIPHFGANGEDVGVFVPGHWDAGINKFVVEFDPTDTSTVIELPQGGTTTMAHLAKNFLNEGKLSEYLPDSEMTYESRAAFNLANPDGLIEHQGRILAGYLDPNSKSYGHSAYEGAFIATHAVHGSNPIIDVPGVEKIFEIPEINGILESEIKETLISPSFEPIDIRGPELIPPLDAPPGIPIPWAPRFPLERLMALYGYNGSEFNNSIYGLMTHDEHQNRRSPSLSSNPNSILNEKKEIDWYINHQEEDYVNELEQLNNSGINNNMTSECRMVITIPARNEGKNIKHTLEQFLNQKDDKGNFIDPNFFEIIIVENHPTSENKDETENEINSFLQSNPTIRVKYIHKVWEQNEGCVGLARKYAADLALLRASKRQQQNTELILVSQDADVNEISEQYVHSIINAFDTDPNIDALAGKWTLPPEVLKKKTLKAAQRLWYILDRVIQKDAAGDLSQRHVHTPGLIGRNAAFKSSIYAAIGGYNPKAKLAEDLEIGWMIGEARNWDNSRFQYLNKAEVVTLPRRFLTSFIQGTPLIQMYSDFHENTDIRKLNEQELIKKIPDDFDVKRFEKEVDALWQAYKSGQYSWLGPRFEELFKKTLNFYIGIEYEIVESTDPNGKKTSHVNITNAQKLVDSLNKYN